MKMAYSLAGFILSCALTSGLHADTVTLTSLEWPPYSGEKLPEGGASVAVAKAAFAAMGHELVVEFYPWSRAVKMAKDDAKKYAGYFPEYYADSVAKEFHFSDPMGTGPLGLVERVDKPLKWEKVEDLSTYTIGVVQDYVNTTEFDTLAAQGKIKTQTVTSDTQDLMKVQGGRVDAAVIDKNVLNYLLKNDPQAKSANGKVQFNAHLLEDKKLYVCFRNDEMGQKWQHIFNEGLKKIDINAIMAKHMQ